MTEAGWLTWNDPALMLEHLRGRVSDRKLRLFACGCCRRVWPLLKFEKSREAVEVAERFADGLADATALRAAARGAQQAYSTAPGHDTAAFAAVWCACDDAYRAARLTALHAATPTTHAQDVSAPYREVYERPSVEEMAGQCRLLLDLFTDQFRPMDVDPSWLAWNDGMIPQIAQAIYNDRAFDRLPILADALEDAGCDNADILHHCRQPGEHFRGCWVVDLLLGKH